MVASCVELTQECFDQQADASPSPTPTRRRIFSRPDEPNPVLSGDDDQNDDDPDGDITGGGDSQGQMVKKLVRLALASEYSRNPIRRQDITAKGLSYLGISQDWGLMNDFGSHGT